MIDIPFGLSIAETDDGFILYRKDATGIASSFSLTTEETFGLKTKLDSWSAQQLLYAQAKSGSVRAVVALRAEEAEVAMDALQADV